MEISIKLEIDKEKDRLEENLRKTEEVVLSFQKELIWDMVTKQFSEEYVKRKRRLNALKSPFIKAREILQEILGENIERMETEEHIDMAPVDIESENTKKIINRLSYEELIKYFIETNKHGLKKTNTRKG